MKNFTCTSWHKYVVNDEYYGFCPICGAFNNLHFGGNDAHGRLHEMYDDKNAHSDYAKHEQFHKKYDNTTDHVKVSTAGMSGSSVYSEELKKSKKLKINMGNQTGEGDKKKGASALKWFIVTIIIVNLVPAIIKWLMAFISIF